MKRQQQTKSSFNKHPSGISENYQLNQTKNLHQNKKQINMDSENQQDHRLLYKVIEKNKKKTIQHKVNQINPQSTILYKTNFENNKNSQSLNHQINTQRYDKKLNKLYSKIKSQSNYLSKSQNKNQVRQNNSHSIKNISDQNKVKNNDKMVNVSAIVSHKFKSMLSQKNLIYNPLKSKSSQQLLSASLQNIKQKSNCPIDRKNRISYRSVSNKSKQAKHKLITFEQNIINEKDKQINTDSFLKKVVIQKRNIQKVYGQQESKLSHISYLMKELGFEREVAQFATDNIGEKIKEQFESNQNNIEDSKFDERNRQARLDGLMLIAKKFTMERDERELNRRRKIVYRSKRSRNLYYDGDKSQLRNLFTNNRSAVMLTHFNFVSEYEH